MEFGSLLTFIFFFFSLKDYTGTRLISASARNFSSLLAYFISQEQLELIQSVNHSLNAKLVLLKQTFSFLNTE